MNIGEKNTNKIKDYLKVYYSNPDNLKRIYTGRKQKYNNDVEYRIRATMRSQINNNLKDKCKKTPEYLGCSIHEFKEYLSSLFLPEMNWENHGEIWEIDHIIPLSSFDFSIESNVYLAFHYSNTQPLFKTTEIAKSFSYVDQIGNRNKSKSIT